LRKLESESIRDFLWSESTRLTGRVLDFGAGKQPYRDLVDKAGGEYVPWDDPAFPASVAESKLAYPTGMFETVICTQVLQYVDNPVTTLNYLRHFLKTGGWLLITGPTNWPVVEAEDMWRFTTTGMSVLLHRAGFKDTTVKPRAAVVFEGERWSLGWEAVAQA
jgi:hypothetical protein